MLLLQFLLLIAPKGIEILFVHEADTEQILLIAPKGIEISQIR